ncbi:MAG: hypothetical protein ACI9K1_002682, partial [Arcticibacterium sp.]
VSISPYSRGRVSFLTPKLMLLESKGTLMEKGV